jgi:spermidine synthase
MRRLTTCQTDFQTTEVWGNAQEAEFRVAGATHAWWHRSRWLTGLAWDCLAAACMLRPAAPPRSLLMLGLGGGTTIRALRRLLPSLECVAVELDGGMIRLAQKYMELDQLGITVIHGDAYQYLASCGRTFDVVMDDVYAAGALDVSRPGAYTDAMAADLSRCLDPDSLFVANLVTGAGHRTMQSRFRQFCKDRFAMVRSISTPLSMNEALVAGRQVLPGSTLHPMRHLWASRQDASCWQALRTARLK